MRDRGVSDIVGFVLVFAIIVATVGVVYATGMSGLQNVRDAERVDNAERAFDVLADNVDDITQRNAPGRATEIKLADAQLRAGEPTTISVSGERYRNPNQNFSFEFGVRPIVYDAGTGTRILYVGGAVIREGQTGAVMVEEPNFVLTEERTLLPIVWTHFEGTRSISGSSTVLVRSKQVPSHSRLVTARTGHAYNVTLDITTGSAARARAWRRFLETKRSVECSLADTTVSCRVVGTERVYVTQIWISIAFE